MNKMVITISDLDRSPDTRKSLVAGQPREVLAALSLFIGLSSANAMGGSLQMVFWFGCLLFMLLRQHRVPHGLMVGVVLCGIVAMLSSLRFDVSITPVLRFVRPFVEGYFLAILLYYGFRIRTFSSLLAALSGYVLAELISALAMFSLPELRTALLGQFYGDDADHTQAFSVALMFRGFGVSRHHLFGFPLALGVISVLLLVGARQENRLLRRGMLTSAAAGCILLILFNARIGLLPLITLYALGVSFFFRFYYLRQILLIIGLGIPIFHVLVPFFLGDVGVVVLNWLWEGVIQFIDPSGAADATTVSTLGAMVHLPAEPMTWLIGEGRICQPGENCYTDIGWIRLLQEGGLLLAVPVSLLYLGVMIKIHSGLCCMGMNRQLHRGHSSGDLLLWVLLVTFVLATIKGDAYATNDYSRLIMMLAVLVHQLSTRRRRARPLS